MVLLMQGHAADLVEAHVNDCTSLLQIRIDPTLHDGEQEEHWMIDANDKEHKESHEEPDKEHAGEHEEHEDGKKQGEQGLTHVDEHGPIYISVEKNETDHSHDNLWMGEEQLINRRNADPGNLPHPFNEYAGMYKSTAPAIERMNDSVWYHDVYPNFKRENSLFDLSLTNPGAAPWPNDPEGWDKAEKKADKAAEDKWLPIEEAEAKEADNFYMKDFPFMTGDAPEDQLDRFTRYRSLFPNERSPLSNKTVNLDETTIDAAEEVKMLAEQAVEEAKAAAGTADEAESIAKEAAIASAKKEAKEKEEKESEAKEKKKKEEKEKKKKKADVDAKKVEGIEGEKVEVEKAKESDGHETQEAKVLKQATKQAGDQNKGLIDKILKEVENQ